jgi:hypothetical protein
MPANKDAIALLKSDHRKVLFEKCESPRSKKADIAKQILGLAVRGLFFSPGSQDATDTVSPF